MAPYTSKNKPNGLNEKVWRLEYRDGCWQAFCIPCHHGPSDGISPYSCKTHEKSTRHQHAYTNWFEREERQPPSLLPSEERNSLPPLPHLSELEDSDVYDPYPREKSSGIDWYELEQLDSELQEGDESQVYSTLTRSVLDIWQHGPDNVDSEDEVEGDRLSQDETPVDDEVPYDEILIGMAPKRGRTSVSEKSMAWFPWDDRITCTLDIMMHLPRSIFSQKQQDLFNWLLRINGVHDVPSPKTMNALNEKLQKLYGIQTFKYKGALGHIYYVNSIADLIASAMSDPNIRPHLWFYPEDSGSRLSEARQAAQWLKQIHDDELTPMIRVGNENVYEDYYIYEPALLRSTGWVVMPHRWFVRNGRLRGKCWRMKMIQRQDGSVSWRVLKSKEVEVDEDDLVASFLELKTSWEMYNLTDPTKIEDVWEHGEDTPISVPWTKTNPAEGNPWRARAKGNKCLFFPIWLYCDDTSGNVSKKWNAHNSFLFTPAGLPRQQASKEYNVNFLCTSNTARPMEMLEGIVDQLCDAQVDGIWAWDCVENAPVLLRPSVLAMLGDNPMQSEFACHVGLMGKFFCRVCKVKGKDAENSKGNTGSQLERSGEGSENKIGNVDGESDDGRSVASDMSGPEESNTASSGSVKEKRKGRSTESMNEMIGRALDFIKPGIPRTRNESVQTLEKHMQIAKEIGSKTRCDRLRTTTGIKDTYQLFFIQQLHNSYKERKGVAAKQAALKDAITKLPTVTMSPIWRVCGLNPHSDTPVEVLHVVLLGFVKYLWRDVVRNQLKDSSLLKDELAARLCSIHVDGLGTDSRTIPGETLVNFAGSLTGADFRKIAQVAPFVLHDMVSKECYDTWVVLSKLIPLIWQPEILDVIAYLKILDMEIRSFLLHAAKWSIRWFNKPKFHILVHLPEHIRRFGPSILFATETFESFNAVIRAKSVHSNRQAPSRDIALQFAQGHRIRHAMSGGKFLMKDAILWTENEQEDRKKLEDTSLPQSERITDIQLYFRRYTSHADDWATAGTHCLQLVKEPESRRTFGRYLGLGDKEIRAEENQLRCKFNAKDPTCHFKDTLTGQRFPNLNRYSDEDRVDADFRKATIVILQNGDFCSSSSFVVVCLPGNIQSIGRIQEILHLKRSLIGDNDKSIDSVLVQLLDVSLEASAHGMPRLYRRTTSDEWIVLEPKNLLCIVNTQHDCIRNKCSVKQGAIVRQERKVTGFRKGRIEHAGSPNNIILNTAQMRSAKFVQPFRIGSVSLPAEQVIFESAKKEVDIRKTIVGTTEKGKKKSSATVRSSTSHDNVRRYATAVNPPQSPTSTSLSRVNTGHPLPPIPTHPPPSPLQLSLLSAPQLPYYPPLPLQTGFPDEFSWPPNPIQPSSRRQDNIISYPTAHASFNQQPILNSRSAALHRTVAHGNLHASSASATSLGPTTPSHLQGQSVNLTASFSMPSA